MEKVAPSLVAKERDYIAQAATYTVGISRPILENAVNNLTTQDVARIVQGTTATQILKEKLHNSWLLLSPQKLMKSSISMAS